MRSSEGVGNVTCGARPYKSRGFAEVEVGCGVVSDAPCCACSSTALSGECSMMTRGSEGVGSVPSEDGELADAGECALEVY